MRRTLLLSTMALTLAAATAKAQSITYDFDKAADFSKIKTYAWVRGTFVRDELNHKRIVTAIETQLTAKGLVEAPSSATPDIYVTYHADFESDVEVSGYATGGFGGGFGFAGTRTGSARTREIVTGTIAVDMINPQTMGVVWRGIASKEVDLKADPAKRDKNINKAAEKLFAKYPPAK